MSHEMILTGLMKVTGLSSRGLARALNFPENAISYYINEKRRPSLLNCYRIINFAKRYNIIITLEELLPNDADKV